MADSRLVGVCGGFGCWKVLGLGTLSLEAGIFLIGFYVRCSSLELPDR